MNLEYIKEEEYENTQAINLFLEDEYSRSFGKFSLGNINYKLAWRSDIIVPKIKQINEELFFIGIDNDIAFLNPDSKVTKLKLKWNFFDFYELDNKLYVVTELSVLIFDPLTLQLIEEKEYPDIINDIEVLNNKLQLTCMDGTLHIV